MRGEGKLNLGSLDSKQDSGMYIEKTVRRHPVAAPPECRTVPEWPLLWETSQQLLQACLLKYCFLLCVPLSCKPEPSCNHCSVRVGGEPYSQRGSALLGCVCPFLSLPNLVGAHGSNPGSATPACNGIGIISCSPSVA